MEKILFKEIVKLICIVVSSLIILSLIFWDKQLELVIAFIIGVFLGVFRLKALFGYVTGVLNGGKLKKDRMPIIKYASLLVFTIGAIGFALVKSVTIGLAVLLGLISVPILVTCYTAYKGISLYKKK
jgi:hypothetical protein